MTLIDKTYSFYCKDLNNSKYELLLKKAHNLRDFRNDISNTISSDYLYYINLSKFDWITKFRTKLPYCNNQDISKSIEQVYVSYENKRERFKKNTTVKIQNNIKLTKHTKNTLNFKKGDIKEFKINFKSTKLTTIITYLTKYYNEDLINFIKNNVSDNKEINQFRKDVLFYINKYGENRLINLAKNKQKRILESVFKYPIVFESLSFTSCTEQKQNIINKNKKTSSIYNTYISLPGQNTKNGKIHIPIKYSNKYHGKIKHYYKKPNKKNQINHTYTVIFENKKLRICLTKKSNDDTIINKNKYYGVDVNVKHNLFCDKYGNEIDYDRNIINDYVKFLKKIDNKKTINNGKQLNKNKSSDNKEISNNNLVNNKQINNDRLSNKDKRLKDKWRIRILNMLKKKSNLLIKQSIRLGKDHIVMEDLGLLDKSFVRNEELLGFKYSRLFKLLYLNDLKNIIRSIGNKHGLQVSFIQSEYTSKACDKCGLIDNANRLKQEEFKCIRCGHEGHADTHSAKMIEDRLSIDVLRQSLLIKENGLYKPKKLKREIIKRQIVECYDNSNNNYCIEQ